MFTREPDALTAVKPRRWRFWLLVLGVPLVLVGLAVVGWVASAGGVLRQAMAETDARDPTWRLDDLEAARATPPPGQNAAERVTAIANRLRLQTLPQKWSDLVEKLSPPTQLDEQQAAALRAYLDAAGPQALAEARALIETPRGRHVIAWAPDAYSTILKCQDNRDVVALLRADALDRAQAGDLTGAVAACHAAFHAGCSLGDEPTGISQLVRASIQTFAVLALERVLAQGEPPADALAALQARIEAEEPAPLLLYALRGERAAFHVLFENLRNGTVPNLPTGPAKVQASVLGGSGDPDVMNLLMHVPGFLTAQHAAFLRNLNEWIEIAKRPPEEWEALLAQERAKLPNLPILVRLLTPALDRLAQAYLRNHANLRCAIVAVAAERFRQQQKRWPESAGELVQAGLLGAVPTDPYDRKPIKFARTADGLVVYCIGPDGADNGGKIDRQNPFKTGIDFGFQLWDLAARRAPSQPPRPPSPVDGRGPPP